MALAFILLRITWLPVVIITAIEGILFADTPLPFLKDVFIQGRVLIGMPLILMIGYAVYRNSPAVLQYVTEVLMPAEVCESFISFKKQVEPVAPQLNLQNHLQRYIQTIIAF